MTPIEKVLDAIGQDSYKKDGNGYAAKCPGHEDKKASLHIAVDESGKVLINCKAGCEFRHIVASMGLEQSDLFPDDGKRQSRGDRFVCNYEYTDETGKKKLHRTARLKDPKKFYQERYENGVWKPGLDKVRRVLYRLPRIKAAIEAGKPIYLVEGEKDVHTLEHWGLTATTNPMGADKWIQDYSKQLQGAKQVILIPDEGEAGIKSARSITTSLYQDSDVEHVQLVRLPGLPGKGDVTDWKNAGNTKDDLLTLIENGTAGNGLEIILEQSFVEGMNLLKSGDLETASKLIDGLKLDIRAAGAPGIIYRTRKATMTIYSAHSKALNATSEVLTSL